MNCTSLVRAPGSVCQKPYTIDGLRLSMLFPPRKYLIASPARRRPRDRSLIVSMPRTRPENRGRVMVPKILADTGQVAADLDSELPQQCARPDPRDLEDLGGSDRTARQDDLAPGTNLDLRPAAPALRVADAGRTPTLEKNAGHMGPREHGKIGPPFHRMEKGPRRRDPPSPVGGALDIGYPLLPNAVVVRVARYAEFGRPVHEHLAKRMPVAEIGDLEAAVTAAEHIVAPRRCAARSAGSTATRPHNPSRGCRAAPSCRSPAFGRDYRCAR